MARDHALALTLPKGSAILRLYRWDRPTLSLGRNEPARGVIDPDATRARGVDVVRRPTGGRAVLHWRELTYAVVTPVRAMGGPRRTYGFVHEILSKALVSLGVPAEIAPAPARMAGVDAGACFAAPAGGELVAAGRKLVGSAQLRVGDALLQHGSILLGNDQDLIAELGAGARAAGPGPTTVSDLLRRELDEGELETALLDAFGIELSCTALGGATSPIEAELERRYRSEAWTWRR